MYDSNPYSTGAKNPKDNVLKITITGLPLSVDDSAVFEMLHGFEVEMKSELKYGILDTQWLTKWQAS